MRFEYNHEKLVKRLRFKRLIDKELNIKKAAKEIGISPATLSRVENGNMPTLTTLASVCYWAELSIYDCISPIIKKK